MTFAIQDIVKCPMNVYSTATGTSVKTSNLTISKFNQKKKPYFYFF